MIPLLITFGAPILARLILLYVIVPAIAFRYGPLKKPWYKTFDLIVGNLIFWPVAFLALVAVFALVKYLVTGDFIHDLTAVPQPHHSAGMYAD